MMHRRLMCVIERADEGFVSLCPQLDIAGQGQTVEAARANLTEALTLFFEEAGPEAFARRFRDEIYVTTVNVAV